ncbi:MAG TPA: sigma-54 dependent transcriptional regulator [Candidatus Dormibacteraeota bacterium]|nr:sigma-54 dependent transcriptional regulator [Candidatus Dormibacteraeota bacterium]
MKPRVLIVDDEEDSRSALQTLLETWGYAADVAAEGRQALEKASSLRPSLVITDLVMPDMDGLTLMSALQQELPRVPVIILTGRATVDTAVAAMRQGAYDYLTKPVDLDRLRLLIEKALDRARTLDEITILRRRVKEVWGLGRLIGRSAPMQEVHRLIEQAAGTPAPVLIHGETGTGKELVARTLHELSGRAAGPFVAVNCAAMPETLLESEIFGHERGAFTDARDRREGCFELAHGGTLLLDEVAEMQPGTQAKFLRVLEEGSFRRLGGKSEIRVDVRVVAATNKDPVAAMKDGSFREDLYYRLNVFTLSVPPLRQRVDDIPLIVSGFIEEFNGKYDKRITGADDPTLKLLMAHAWPGNVRELRNVVERAFIACEGDVITSRYLPATSPVAAAACSGDPDALTIPLGLPLREVEKQFVLRTLAAESNNKTRAADRLDISTKTLHNMLQRWGLLKSSSRS